MVIDVTKDSPFANNDKFWRKLIPQIIRRITDPQDILFTKRIPKMRIKILYFRDYYFDGRYAFGESAFFDIPEDLSNIFEYLNSIQAAGGGDIPESGLEALWMALNIDYEYLNSFSHRTIITLCTNAPAHPLEEYHSLVEKAHRKNCCAPVNYPEKIPRNLAELGEFWEDWTDPAVATIVLIAPEEEPWSEMEVTWSNLVRIDPELLIENMPEEINYMMDIYWEAVFGMPLGFRCY